jgi:hypothetical protein
VYGLKDASPGQRAEGGAEGSPVHGKLLSKHTLGRQALEQLPAPFEKGLFQLLFDGFLLVHDDLNKRTFVPCSLLFLRHRQKETSFL